MGKGGQIPLDAALYELGGTLSWRVRAALAKMREEGQARRAAGPGNPEGQPGGPRASIRSRR